VLPRFRHAGALVDCSECLLLGFGKEIVAADVEFWVREMGLRRRAETRLKVSAAACEKTHRPDPKANRLWEAASGRARGHHFRWSAPKSSAQSFVLFAPFVVNQTFFTTKDAKSTKRWKWGASFLGSSALVTAV